MKRALTVVGAALAAISMVVISPIEADAAPVVSSQQSHSELNQLSKVRRRIYVGGVGIGVGHGRRRRRR